MKRWHYPTWFRIVLGILAAGLYVSGFVFYSALIDFDAAAQYRAAHAAALAGLNELPDDHADLLNEGWRQLADHPITAAERADAANRIAADGAVVTYLSGMSNGLIAAVAVAWTGAVGATLLIVRPRRRPETGEPAPAEPAGPPSRA